MTLLWLDGLTVRRGECPVVDGVSLEVAPGDCVGLIGPNGAGKTTLLRAALGLLAHEGASSLSALAPAARAAAAAFLPQGREVAWPVSVADLVRLAARDAAALERALDRMGLQGYRERNVLALSGGELARVLLARALAQDTPLLLADEPVAGLDPAAQLRALQVLRDLAEEGRGGVVSIHDLGLAARFCTRLVLMHRGRVVANGPPAAVLTPETLAQVFGIRAHLAEVEGRPVVLPLEVTG